VAVGLGLALATGTSDLEAVIVGAAVGFIIVVFGVGLPALSLNDGINTGEPDHWG
jgi:hypothetical protein